MDEYTAWANVPENLKTKTQLKEMGLKPAPGQAPAALFLSYVRGKGRPRYYNLYDFHEAKPKPEATPAQLAALDKAMTELVRRCTCKRCQTRSFKPLRFWPYCRWCHDHVKAVEWAQAVLSAPQAIILDTETTSLDGEPIEIAVITTAGEVLLNTLVQATEPISPSAMAIHGITQADLTNAPAFPEVYPALGRILGAASKIVVYNAHFDFDILENARKIHKLPLYPAAEPWENNPDDCRTWRGLTCAMEMYAQWVGQWSDYHRSYKWQPLNGGHRALGDCQATLAAIQEMATDKDDVYKVVGPDAEPVNLIQPE